ncbi:MAG: hypothetical protein ACFE9T_02910 [Promethearchaeota archaeon]
MKRSKIYIGSKVILFLGWYTIVIAILWIFATEIMFVSDFEAYTGVTYSEYVKLYPEVSELYIITKKMIGIFLLMDGLLILLINQYGYSKGEKWSWYALLIAGSIPWGTFIGYKLFIWYIGISMITFILGAALFLTGLILPAKEILSKK